MAFQINRQSLLSSQARIQVPWVKVTIKSNNNEFTFGVFSRQTKQEAKDKQGNYLKDFYKVQYPNYIQSLQITKINGQVNQYVLQLVYPIRAEDDPNLFEKLFSNTSKTRKIIFTYGDATQPSYVYKNEEAIITTISQSFNLSGSSISYTINAISSASLYTTSCASFPAYNNYKPSKRIKEIFYQYPELQKLFSGMNEKNWNRLIAQDDKKVDILAKTNISVLEYIRYLVSCMYEDDLVASKTNPKSIYILTIHDNSSYDSLYNNDGYNYSWGTTIETDNGKHKTFEVNGPYFKVEKISYMTEKSDAYEVDVGYNTSTIVTSFSLENNENYSLYYDYQQELHPEQYSRRLGNDGKWYDEYAPTISSKNNNYMTMAADKTWWTKITQFPINANMTIQGLLRPAQLLTYIRLNIIFPGGHQHIGSGLYIITKQTDTLDENGYRTQLSMTKVGGALLNKEK